MKDIQKFRLSSLICIALFACTFATAQDLDTLRFPLTIEFAPTLTSIQVDGTTLVFTGSLAVSADFDFIRIEGNPTIPLLGIRAGVDYYTSGDFEGGNTYRDYNVLGRFSLKGEVLRFDLIGGYAYQYFQYGDWQPLGWNFKGGANLRWTWIPGFCGMVVKAEGTRFSSAIGIGFYAGWNQ